MEVTQGALPFVLTGTVVHGKHLGHQIGFPTANIACSAAYLPKDGVYAGTAKVHETGKDYLMIVNQGMQPTAPSGERTVEAHLIDFEEADLYGQTITITYQVFLRKEQKFSSLEGLMAQLKEDCKAAKQWQS